MTDTRAESGSFRDRHGRIFYSGGRIYRALSSKAWNDWQHLSSTHFFKEFTSRGLIVPTRAAPGLDPQELGGNWAGVVEHERIPFVSYPYEWCFSMLQDAALLQLDLLLAALGEDMVLKDATSYNVQWVGTRPVFIDTASFEDYRGEPWQGYRQFSQLFLYPLMLQSYKGLPFQPLLRGRIEGIPPADCNAIMSARDLFRSGVFSHVFLQSKSEKWSGSAKTDVRKSLRAAGFNKEVILANLRKIRKLIARLQWKPAGSTWSDYASDNTYSDSDGRRKRKFVQTVIEAHPRTLVWDLGCNTGVFSRIAATNSAYVVSIDADQLAVERLYLRLRQEKIRGILPLVNDLADASPGLGWKASERRSLTNRGRPDLILALALIHHVVISANIPLPDFVEWLAQHSRELVLEFVDKSDPMVETLLRNKDDQYTDYEKAFLEKNLKRFYRIESRQNLESGTRTLYYCVPRQ